MDRHNRSYWYIFLAPLFYAFYGFAMTELLSEPLFYVVIAIPVGLMLASPGKVACFFIGHDFRPIHSAIIGTERCAGCGRVEIRSQRYE